MYPNISRYIEDTEMEKSTKICMISKAMTLLGCVLIEGLINKLIKIYLIDFPRQDPAIFSHMENLARETVEEMRDYFTSTPNG